MRDVDHVTEIGRVLDGAATGRDDLVSDSWRRCVETYGMDPTRPDPAHIVTASELRAHREQSERLIATARSGLHSLFRQVAGHNYVLLLANAQGICVDFFGDQRFEDELRQAGALPRLELDRGSCGHLWRRILHRHRAGGDDPSGRPLRPCAYPAVLHRRADPRHAGRALRRAGYLAFALALAQGLAEPRHEPRDRLGAAGRDGEPDDADPARLGAAPVHQPGIPRGRPRGGGGAGRRGADHRHDHRGAPGAGPGGRGPADRQPHRRLARHGGGRSARPDAGPPARGQGAARQGRARPLRPCHRAAHRAERHPAPHPPTCRAVWAALPGRTWRWGG